MADGADLQEDLSFSVSLEAPDTQALSEGFNRHGVKEDEDRVEFVFEAMQPGMRRGVKITEDFLRQVAENFDSEIPLMAFHDKRQLSRGNITDMWFSDGALRLRGYTPKTGARSHDEVIKRFTFDPPQIEDGSVGFGRSYEIDQDEDGNPMLTDAQAQEFSLTHFPGGYDEETGGLKAQFAEAYQEHKLANAGDDDPQSEEVGFESADSHLVTETIQF